jgi:plastocyanin
MLAGRVVVPGRTGRIVVPGRLAGRFAGRDLAALFAAIALATAGVSRSDAGSVSGSVTLGPVDLAIHDSSKPNPYVGQLTAAQATAAKAAASDTIYGVAWVDEPGPAGTIPPPARMDQLGQKFVPRILAIVPGQTVEFHNSDNVYHNIFSYSPPKKFDLGRYPKGKSRSVKFVKAGTVQVYCDIHSDMRADIIVAPSRRFALVGPSGRFRIDGVSPGTHVIAVWLPSGVRSSTVEVPQQGVALLPTLVP